MLDILLLLTAFANGSPDRTSVPFPAQPAATPMPAVPDPVATAPAPTPATPTGQFTTAAEVRPILDITRNTWIAISQTGDQELLYLTQVLSWRCGLDSIQVSINGGPLEPWEMEPCHEGTNAPNALTSDMHLIYRSFPAGSIRTVTVGLTYDDLSVDLASFERAAVLMP